MRCDEVIRELALSTGSPDATAMAQHLAGCPACAEWARRAAQLDRLWDATRPSEPPPEVWGSIWANIARTLDSLVPSAVQSPAAPRPSRNGTSPQQLEHPAAASLGPAARSRTWRLAPMALIRLASAAALLIALGLAWHLTDSSRTGRMIPIAKQPDQPIPPHVPSVIRVSHPVRVEADIEEGRQVVIRAEGTTPQVWDVTPPDLAHGVDPWLVMYNLVESITYPEIASR
jgi:hypothetical protein